VSNLSEQLKHYRERANKALDVHLGGDDASKDRLHSAMYYAATNGGKRIRPSLTYATAAALNVPLQRMDVPACAVELLHAYSLVHDDLPSMDNDDLRRGLPTCHRQYDEATAILAGDALQALSFTLLANNPDPDLSCTNKIEMIRVLGEAIGANGMAAGQAIDLESVGKSLSLDKLEDMHRLKTGALIRASVRMATLALPHNDPELEKKLDGYATALGLAFQIADDILDVVGDTETLGKAQGADIAMNKPTYPALLGLHGARKHAETTLAEALESLRGLGDDFDELRQLAHFVVQRTH